MNKIIKFLDMTLKLIGSVLGIGLCIFAGAGISLLIFMFFLLLFKDTQPPSIVIPFFIKICIIIFFTAMWIISSIQFFVEHRNEGRTYGK